MPKQSNSIANYVSEAKFTAEVIRFAQEHGWRVAHFRAARTAQGWRTPVEGDGAGFFDLVMVRRERLIFAENKSEEAAKRRLPDDQQLWRDVMLATGKAEVYLWKPSDWSEITAILGREG